MKKELTSTVQVERLTVESLQEFNKSWQLLKGSPCSLNCVISGDRHRIKFIKNCSNAVTVQRQVINSNSTAELYIVNSNTETYQFQSKNTALKLPVRSYLT